MILKIDSKKSEISKTEKIKNPETSKSIKIRIQKYRNLEKQLYLKVNMKKIEKFITKK